MSTQNGKNGTPSANGRNGNGTFAKGNAGGPGNPQSKAVNKFRSMLIESTTVEEFQAVRNALVKAAKAGQPWAVKEYLDRIIGKPKESVEVTGDTQHTMGVVREGIAKLSRRIDLKGLDLS